MPQQLVKDIGGTVETYILDRQVASCTVTLYDDSGSEKATGTGAVDSVSTTLSALASVGDASVTVASASGIVSGRRYLLDGTVPEVVTVKDVSGTTVTLFRPLTRRHASGSTFKGTRVSLAVSSSDCATVFADGYARFTPNTGEPVEEVVDVVLRKIPKPLIDDTDLWEVFPKGFEILDAELDIVTAMAKAREDFMFDLGGKFRATCMVGTQHLRGPCAKRFWLNREASLGDQWAANMKALRDSYDIDIENLQSQIPVDADEDGATNGQNDGGITSIRLERM